MCHRLHVGFQRQPPSDGIAKTGMEPAIRRRYTFLDVKTLRGQE
jgi:hypothetical protein